MKSAYESGTTHPSGVGGCQSLAIIATILLIGTLGIHLLEGMSYVDSFYFTSMIATGEGPSSTPQTTGGKIFASILSFVSVGSVVASLIYLFGPFAGKLFREGFHRAEEEIEKIAQIK